MKPNNNCPDGISGCYCREGEPLDVSSIADGFVTKDSSDRPDLNCYTLPDGRCIGVDCMHNSGPLTNYNTGELMGAGFVTKDSGERAEFSSGMVRDTERGKPRFDLLIPEGVPYSDQILTRFAALMTRGAEKYDARNWELAEGEAELARYKSSALRHLMQWLTNETDEDHASAVMFNLMAAETLRYKLESG